MGLDISHGCWHGSYRSFHKWRKQIAEAAGLPPLELMDGFFCPHDDLSGGHPTFYLGLSVKDNMVMDSIKRIEDRLPISWGCLKPDTLHILLQHSDYDGEIAWEDCARIAERLQYLLDEAICDGDEDFPRQRTNSFIAGLMLAYSKEENVVFA